MPVVFVKSLPADAVADAASQMEPRLRAAFLRAVARLRGTLTEDKIAEALESGDTDSAMAMLAVDHKFVADLNASPGDGIESLRDALRATATVGARAAIRSLPTSVSASLSFDMKSAEAQSFLESYTFPLIRQLSANTTDAIRGVILDAFRSGGHPYEQARRIRPMIGLTATQAQAVGNYRDSLSGLTPLASSLDRKLRDARFDGTVQRAINNRATLSSAQIDNMVGRYSERYLKYRAESIARTESVRASNQGRREAWRQAVAQKLLPQGQKRRWIVSGDDRTCPICMALDGVEVGLDEEFAPDIMDPPDPHSTCRCATSLVIGRAA